MELNQYELQVFLSLVVILGAALVALICDLLKGNNEQLRELAIELKVRREEEQKRFQMLLPHAAGHAIPERTARLTVASAEKKRAMSPQALAAMAKGEQMAAAPRPRVKARAASEVPAPRSTPRFQLVRVPAASTPTFIAKSSAGRDWNSLVQPPAKTPAAEPPLPFGFQDGFALSRLAASRQRISGLVVSIGVNSSLPSNMRTLIESLMGPGDFAAQSGPEEFLLIFPGERGASAQRRLTLVAQELWDFQLRSSGSSAVLFSWGGVEVRSEAIDEAIASATERMEETRRSRKILTAESRPALAQAV